MRWILAGAITLAAILLPFALFAESMDGWTLRRLQAEASPSSIAASIIALLAVDIVLPVPSSLVSTMGGALLGIPAGFAASLAGMTVGCQLGYALGRCGMPLARRFISENELTRVSTQVNERGIWAFAMMRPIPVLAEASALWAGVMRVRPLPFSLVTLAANAGVSALYAAVGAAAMPAESVTLVLAVGIALPAFALLIGLRRRQTVALLWASFFITPIVSVSAAQQLQDPPRFKTEIVVTPERGETPKTAVPVATSVLEAGALPTLPAVHVTEILPFMNGLVTSRSEFHAGRPIVSARGFFGGGEAEYLILLVDGVPIADAESGLIDWALVPASSVARMEASRGPGSSLYGDSAVGGVVQVLTNRTATGGRMTLAGGSFTTLIADGAYGRRRQGVSYDVTGAARSTDGAYEHSAATQFGGSLGLDGAIGGFSWRWNVASNLHERDDPGPVRRDSQGTVPEAQPSPYRFDVADRTTHSTAFSLAHASAWWRPQLRVYAGIRDEESVRTILLVPEFGDRRARDLSTAAVGGTLEGEHRFAGNRPVLLRFGVDLSRESLDSGYRHVSASGVVGDESASADVRRVRSGAFTSIAWEGLSRVRLSTALRWDGVDDNGNAGTASADRSEDAWSPRAGVVVSLTDAGRTSLFLQVSRAFKMPTLDQLFDVRPFPDFRGGTLTISNPNLQPQRATNFEGGISGGTRLTWSAVAYRMTVNNEIDFDVRTFSYGNIGRSRHSGIELEAEGRWSSRVRPFASYTLSRTTDTDTGLQLKNVPRHVIGIGVNADLWWSIAAYARYFHTAGAYLDDMNGFAIDGPSRIDLRVRRAIGRHFAFLDVYNGTNNHFEEYGFTLTDLAGRTIPYIYPGAGAAVRGGLTLSFLNR